MKRLLIVLLTALVIFGCDVSNSSSSSEGNGRIIANSNSNRVHYGDGEIIPIEPDDGGRGSREGANFQLILRAEVDPPEYGGTTLRASHVKIKDNYAYVSYNVEGDQFLGGLDVFDVSDIEHPVLVSQSILPYTDVSGVDYADGKLYLAEQTDINVDTEFESGAVLEVIEVNNGLLSFSSVLKDLPSFGATAVSVENGKAYVTTGNGADGGLFVLDTDTLGLEFNNNFDHARSSAINSDYLVVMQGTPARLKVYSLIDNSLYAEYPLDGANYDESKSDIELVENDAYIALGDGGMIIMDIITGDTKVQFDRPITPPGGVDSDYVTNAISVSDQHLTFVANGGAGITVGQWNASLEYEVLGSIGFNSSANFVEGKDDVIFVASGLGGLKILQVDYTEADVSARLGGWDEHGRPDYLDPNPDVIEDEFIDRIHDAIPSGQNLTQTHSEYFDNVDTAIHLESDGEVWVTFLFEEAGWKNTLGYYYYQEDTPPASLAEINDRIIIFPNTSFQGSGGNMQTGDKVQLKTLEGNTMFPANTVIGFFQISKGWSNHNITEGVYSHYSNYEWNQAIEQSNKQQNVLLYDPNNELVVLGFEDILRPGGDQDFDDAIFSVKSEPANAIRVENLAVMNSGDDDDDD
jgi:hypothetical protein